MKIPLTPILVRFTTLFFFTLLFSTIGCSKKNDASNQVPGKVTTLAGSGARGSADGAGAAASFAGIWGITVDAAGNIYITDTGLGQVRKITSKGLVTTLPDNAPGSTTESGIPVTYSIPLGIAIDGSGDIYVSYLESGVIRKIPTNGKGVLITGNGNGNNQDGVGLSGGVSQPIGLALDGSGIIYVAGYSNTIKKIYSNGLISTFVGAYGRSGNTDGKGAAARFNSPKGIAVDANGNVYVADSANNLIRKITPDGTVSTLAGSGLSGSADGTGSAASFDFPTGVAVDASGNVYVADANNNMIRKITSSGIVTTLAGSATSGSSNGLGSAATFLDPVDVAVNHEGTILYVADRGNNLVRQIGLKK
ncbi:MAG TPA: hypothetical protein VK668_22660 [Mucilaginibacter sp.]|nr:hypothetical protein [Mucilaginibacter sp.]